MLTFDQYKAILSGFSKMKALVIGDVMIDSYIFGKVDRISPEAPVPVVQVSHRINRLGGAANVALNLESLGAEPILCSVTGNDEKKNTFIELLNEKGLRSDGVVVSDSRTTTTKFRIIGNNVQMLRVDEETDSSLSSMEYELLSEKIRELISTNHVDVIIFQDYDKGCITDELISEITSLAMMKNITVTVDPKRRNFNSYKNISLFKPNLKELREGLQVMVSGNNPSLLKEVAKKLHTERAIEHVMITLSENGVFLSSYRNGQQYSVIHPAFVRNIADVSGAGDTVISISSLCLAQNLDPNDIAFLSNLAGGLVCESIGVVPVDINLLIGELKRLV